MLTANPPIDGFVTTAKGRSKQLLHSNVVEPSSRPKYEFFNQIERKVGMDFRRSSQIHGESCDPLRMTWPVIREPRHVVDLPLSVNEGLDLRHGVGEHIQPAGMKLNKELLRN